MNMVIRTKDIDALRESLKIGDHVKYQTEVIDDKPGWVQKEDNDAWIVKKLPRVAIVEHMARRGSRLEPVRSTMTYREIFFQRRGLNW